MGKIIIMTDSASDISEKEEEELGIKILPFPVVIGGKSYLSRVDFDNEGFYKLMAENDDLPKTSQITAYQFGEVYKELVEQGYTDIIYVSINKDGSASYANAKQAADQFEEEYPECAGKSSIYVFDGIGYSGQYGYPVIVAARMVREGKDVKDIVWYLKDELPKRRIYFGIYGLKYAAKSGRIPSAAALVGDALGVKPIMKIWANEIVTAIKCRGEKKLMAKMVDVTVEEMEPGSEYQVVYGNDETVRDELTARMTEKVGYGPSDYFQIGAAVASNAGPKVVGTIFNVKKELR
ncbi:DegV family protein [Coprococcus eutactus]|uniref:DegV family protein n=1 Tax=Coprococcus eutactus TaxID=33043 RepID=A0A3R6A294_9FIRM|nr:DegV family protein [Coprococcus eutactus]